MDFTADGCFALASCEFSGQMVRIDLRTETVDGYVDVGGVPRTSSCLRTDGPSMSPTVSSQASGPAASS